MTPLVRIQEVVPQPWRNGGGRTRELLVRPAATADWRVRISVADIEADGPFSAFPGVRRWFAVLKGAGVELTIGGASRRLTRNDAPFAFDGDAPATCRLLDGPTLDLNLMLRGASGQMLAAADGIEWRPARAQCGLYAAVAGRCEGDGEPIEMPAHALLWFERAPPSLRFVAAQRPAAATAWWLEADAEAGAEAAR
jgi:environmental stress-induced protein Ves